MRLNAVAAWMLPRIDAMSDLHIAALVSLTTFASTIMNALSSAGATGRSSTVRTYGDVAVEVLMRLPTHVHATVLVPAAVKMITLSLNWST
jgi:hypothetical protein